MELQIPMLSNYSSTLFKKRSHYSSDLNCIGNKNTHPKKMSFSPALLEREPLGK
jgi:hypothetical protein